MVPKLLSPVDSGRLSDQRTDRRRAACLRDIAGHHLRVPTEGFSSAGDLIWQQSLDIYGSPVDSTMDSKRVTWRWPGQRFDEDVNLVENRFRYYDTETGQYLSPDPLGLAPSIALYAYPSDSTTQTDPLGLSVTAALVKDMRREGTRVDPGQTAHHIVQRNGGSYAGASEAILQSSNPNWTRDSGSNGVALWGTRGTQVTVAGHPGRGVSGARPAGYHGGNIHGEAAQRAIFERLRDAQKAGLDPEAELRRIGAEMETGKFKCP